MLLFLRFLSIYLSIYLSKERKREMDEICFEETKVKEKQMKRMKIWKRRKKTWKKEWFFKWSCRILRNKLFLFDPDHLKDSQTLTGNCPLGCGCRIHRLHFCGGVRLLTTNECPVYDSKQSDDGVLVMLELWGMWNTASLSSLPGPFWPWGVAPDSALSMGQIELNYISRYYIKITPHI